MWCGTRGAEGQILSPRPILSTGCKRFPVSHLQRCRRFCSCVILKDQQAQWDNGRCRPSANKKFLTPALKGAAVNPPIPRHQLLASRHREVRSKRSCRARFQYFDKLWPMMRHSKMAHFVEKYPLSNKAYTL